MTRDEDKDQITTIVPEQIADQIRSALEKSVKQSRKAAMALCGEADLFVDTFKRAMTAAAESLPGWIADTDYWLYEPKGQEPLTRDEAFKGVCKRRDRWKE